ncbi:MAG: glycosyltransferase family 61 protein [Lewinellaceae bacterium]|nr:glycosyltransferase family 61 protein [Lewinellaceae bacterium]
MKLLILLPMVKKSSICFTCILSMPGIGWLPGKALAYIRKQTFASLRIPHSSNPAKLIYISRGDAQKRKITNEHEIQSFLRNRGFDIIRMNEYSIEDQIQIISSAKMIVAPHGAGLTHLAFAPHDVKVIELLGSLHPLKFFSYLANAMGQGLYLHIFRRFKKKA